MFWHTIRASYTYVISSSRRTAWEYKIRQSAYHLLRIRGTYQACGQSCGRVGRSPLKFTEDPRIKIKAVTPVHRWTEPRGAQGPERQRQKNRKYLFFYLGGNVKTKRKDHWIEVKVNTPPNWNFPIASLGGGYRNKLAMGGKGGSFPRVVDNKQQTIAIYTTDECWRILPLNRRCQSESCWFCPWIYFEILKIYAL